MYNIMTDDDHPYIPEAAIRVGDWKYLWRVTGDDSWQEPPEIGTTQDNDLKVDNLDREISHTNQLFNLADDPTEKINLAHVEQERAEEMKARIREHMKGYLDVDYNHNDPARRPENFDGIWSTGWC